MQIVVFPKGHEQASRDAKELTLCLPGLHTPGAYQKVLAKKRSACPNLQGEYVHEGIRLFLVRQPNGSYVVHNKVKEGTGVKFYDEFPSEQAGEIVHALSSAKGRLENTIERMDVRTTNDCGIEFLALSELGELVNNTPLTYVRAWLTAGMELISSIEADDRINEIFKVNAPDQCTTQNRRVYVGYNGKTEETVLFVREGSIVDLKERAAINLLLRLMQDGNRQTTNPTYRAHDVRARYKF